MADPDNSDDATTPVEAMVSAMDTILNAEMAFLQAEIEAFANLVPGMPRPTHNLTPADDAEIESGFDNMPV